MRARLVERAREGDDTAFSELVDLDGNLCYAIAYRILRDAERAQDAVQQAFLLAWHDLPQLRDAERFGPWLHRSLANGCYEELRRHRRWSTRIRALPMEGLKTRGHVAPQSGNASGPRSLNSAASPEASSGGSHE